MFRLIISTGILVGMFSLPILAQASGAGAPASAAGVSAAGLSGAGMGDVSGFSGAAIGDTSGLSGADGAALNAGGEGMEMSPGVDGANAGASGDAEASSDIENFFNADSASAEEMAKRKVGAVSKGLKQFGYEFFRRGGGFAPDQLALVGPDYVIGPGDSLRIDVWGNVEASYHITVDRNGEVTLPKVGVITLWGQTFEQARESIRRQISRYYTNFEMNVTMGALRSIQIFMVGEVKSPGAYRVSSLSTVLTALSAAGGPAKTGSLRDVRLMRAGKVVTKIDFYDFFLKGDNSSDVRLQSGDTIFVPTVGPLVGVAGNVRRPAVYELKDESTLKEALALAGGVVPTAYMQKVQVERVEAHSRKVVLDLDLENDGARSRGFDLDLRDRDMVKVAPIAKSGDYVQLEGYVVRPGTYQLNRGMRVSDLIIPYDNLLPEYYPGLARIIRLNPPEYRPEALTIDLEKALAGDPEHDLLLQEYDTVRLYSRNEMEELPQVTVTGAVLQSGAYRLYERMTVKDLVSAAGNLKRHAYLPQAEITRYFSEGRETRTERLLIDLEKALAGDPAHNLPLKVDDHLFVRAIPDSSEKLTIQVRGEVLFPGIYAIAKGETLSSVLERAGGFTEMAYLRGAMFTRESLKEIQRQRLQKLIFEQEQEIYRVSSEMSQGAMSEEEVAATEALLESHRQMVAKLRQAPVTGRMVVHLAELDQFRGSASDFELMGGDTLLVPQNPQSVTVLGEVYNATSMTYRPGKTVSFYMDQVGGTTKDADNSQIYIVRADGTVFSKQQSGFGLRWDDDANRWAMGGFNTARIYPGDAILVPEKVKKTDIMKETKDISQIIYQMALGAAAVAAF